MVMYLVSDFKSAKFLCQNLFVKQMLILKYYMGMSTG